MTHLYKVLGYCSTIPFVCAALGLFLFDGETLQTMLLGFLFLYAGFMACFQGGIHWAHGFPRSSEGQLFLSMIPVWIALGFTGWGLVLLTSGMLAVTFGHVLLSFALGGYILLYCAIWVMDAQWLDKTRLPEGYKAHRARVTACVTVSLLASIAFLWM